MKLKINKYIIIHFGGGERCWCAMRPRLNVSSLLYPTLSVFECYLHTGAAAGRVLNKLSQFLAFLSVTDLKSLLKT